MKKFHGLKLFGLVVILAFAFVFVGLDFVQGQVKTLGKPDKPPGQDKGGKYVWSVVILDGAGLGLKGTAGDPDRYDENWLGWVYDDSEPNVNVEVETRHFPFDGNYQTRFSFEVFNPIQIDFDFIPHGAHFYDNTPNAMCIYPGGYIEDDPNSMFYFMRESYHPHPSYDKVYFRFYTDRSAIQEEVHFEQWSNNYHGYLDFLTNISGPAPLAFKPVTCEDLGLFEYSFIQFGGSDGELSDYGYFERIQEDYENMDIWKVVVGMEKNPFYDYTIGQGIGDDAWATDWYNICVEMQYNKKKKGVTYDAIFSSQGSMDIKFEVLFIRTKL